jgi:hypothetical protein
MCEKRNGEEARRGSRAARTTLASFTARRVSCGGISDETRAAPPALRGLEPSWKRSTNEKNRFALVEKRGRYSLMSEIVPFWARSG